MLPFSLFRISYIFRLGKDRIILPFDMTFFPLRTLWTPDLLVIAREFLGLLGPRRILSSLSFSAS